MRQHEARQLVVNGIMWLGVPCSSWIFMHLAFGHTLEYLIQVQGNHWSSYL